MSVAARPLRRSPEVLDYVEAKLKIDVEQWSSGDEVGDEIREALKGSISWDGYELAKYLEKYHSYSSNTELVDILDHADTYQSIAHNDLVRKWVADNNIKPQFAVGRHVEFDYQYKRSTGVVAEINLEEGIYLIAVDGAMGNWRAVKTFEDLELERFE